MSIFIGHNLLLVLQTGGGYCHKHCTYSCTTGIITSDCPNPILDSWPFCDLPAMGYHNPTVQLCMLYEFYSVAVHNSTKPHPFLQYSASGLSDHHTLTMVDLKLSNLSLLNQKLTSKYLDNKMDLVATWKELYNYISGICDVIMFGLHLDKVLCKLSLLAPYRLLIPIPFVTRSATKRSIS